MKLLFGCAIALFSAITPATMAQNAAPVINPVGPAPAQADPVQKVLVQLEKRGQTLDSFVADVRLREENADLGTDAVIRSGKIWYQKLPDGSVRIRVSFTSREDDKGRRAEQRDYVLDRGWLTERDHDKKIQIRRQILRPGEQLNPIKLGEGPFPLPIGQKVEEVNRQFDPKLQRTQKDDPKGSTHLTLKPKPDSEIKKEGYNLIDVFIDPTNDMPVRISTLKGKTGLTTDLDKIQINGQLTDKEFELPRLQDMKGWTIREEPMAR